MSHSPRPAVSWSLQPCPPASHPLCSCAACNTANCQAPQQTPRCGIHSHPLCPSSTHPTLIQPHLSHPFPLCADPFHPCPLHQGHRCMQRRLLQYQCIASKQSSAQGYATGDRICSCSQPDQSRACCCAQLKQPGHSAAGSAWAMAAATELQVSPSWCNCSRCSSTKKSHISPSSFHFRDKQGECWTCQWGSCRCQRHSDCCQSSSCHSYGHFSHSRYCSWHRKACCHHF